jgi:thiol-disulfide isomerase/thioredoxin
MRKSLLLSVFMVLAANAPGQGINVRLKDLDGKKVELADLYKSRPLVVTFWATWCKPCQEELRQLHLLHQAYADSGIGFLAVSIDESRDQGKVRSLVAGSRFAFPVALDPEQRALKRFGFSDVPGTAIIGGAGEVVWKHAGYRPGDEAKLEAEIRKLVKRAEPESSSVNPEEERTE